MTGRANVVMVLKVASTALVVVVFLASLALGWTGDALPSGSLEAQRLEALSATGMATTFALGLLVGFFWLFRERGHDERPRRQ
jgi:uncharacterized protein (TIGR03382 family)